MRVLVTGATGLVGTQLAEVLFRAGHEVVVVSRDAEKAKGHFGFPVEAFNWNAPYEDFPVPALKGVQAVINLMGEDIAGHRWSADQKKRIHDSRVVGTRKLKEALVAAKTVPAVFVSVSAVGFYGDRADEILTEQSARGTGFLSDVCEDWEREAGEVQAGRSIVFRFGVVLSNRGGFLPRLLALFTKGLGGPVGSGKQWIPWIHIDDLVTTLVDALGNEQLSGIRNLTTANPVTNRDFGQTLASVLDKPFGLPAPAFALRLAMGEMASIALDSTRAVGMANLTQRFRFPVLRDALEDLLRAQKKGMILFEANQWVAKPIDEVFPFFSSPHNLEVLTPPWLKFRVVKQSMPQIADGILIDYKLKIKGMPTRWQSRIEEWSPPKKFVDTQVIGPYNHWHHTHTFESVRGGTWLKDVVLYRVPAGAVGSTLLGPMIRNDVNTIFDFRKSKIRELFVGGRG